MRKLLISILLAFSICLFFVYVIIPNPIVVNKSVFINIKSDGLLRMMTKDNKWTELIDDDKIKFGMHKTNAFVFNGRNYNIEYKTVSSIIISSVTNGQKVMNSLNILPHEPDSTQLYWQSIIPLNSNPFTRIQSYLDAKKIAGDITKMLSKVQEPLSKVEAVYGIAIKKEEVNDSILVSTQSTMYRFPTISGIYKLIDNLKQFVEKGGAKVTGKPMLNITTNDSINYLVRVALPVDKALPSTQEFVYKRMMGKGKILRSTVRGGYNAINVAMNQMYNFIFDNHYVNPAIPFQSLITDRLLESDSTKWVTDIYYPVM